MSLTQAFKNWAVERGYKAAGDIAVIPDAFDPGLYYPVDTAEARERASLPLSAFIVGYAGLTFAYRNLDLLVESFAEVARANKNAILLLVGGRPSEVEHLKSLANRLHIPQAQIIMMGQVPQERAARYVQAADVLVVPDTVTSMTASPLKLFEYMAVGKAIICKDMPALREVVDVEAAAFFASGDGAKLAEAMFDLMNDPQRRERMGKAAVAQASGYTYRARATKIAEVVRGVL